MIEIRASANATEVDVDGLVDAESGLRYIGKARRGPDGRWLCLAAVGQALCRVEVTVRPTIHIDGDPGDEDDRPARDVQRDRDLAGARR